MRFPTKNNLLFHSWIQIKEQNCLRAVNTRQSAPVWSTPGFQGLGPNLWTLVATIYILTPPCLRISCPRAASAALTAASPHRSAELSFRNRACGCVARVVFLRDIPHPRVLRVPVYSVQYSVYSTVYSCTVCRCHRWPALRVYLCLGLSSGQSVTPSPSHHSLVTS